MSFESEVVKTTLDNLFNNKGHFDICTVDKLGRILNVNPQTHPDYDLLSALHCVNYSKMSAQMKSELPDRVMTVLTAKFETGLMAKALLAVSTGEINDLPPIEDVEIRKSPRLSLFKGK